MDWLATIGASSSPEGRGQNSLEEGRLKEKTSEKIVGRIRALTGGHSGKIQKREVVPYPGT
jgi:hypothetical protein